MRKRWLLGFLALVVAVSFTLVACAGEATPTPAPAPAQAPAPAPAPEVIKWKLSSSWAPGMGVLEPTAKRWAERVTSASGGRLEVEYFPGGSLVGPLEVFEAVGKGTIQAAHTWPGYWMGKLPASILFAGFAFTPATEGYLGWLYYGGGMDLWRELYAPHNLVPFPGGSQPPEPGGWFNKPIRTLDDYKGLKFRTTGFALKVAQKLGAEPVMLPGAEVYLAMERGVIDGFEWGVPALDILSGFHEVAKYQLYPGWHQTTTNTEIMVNKDAYEALPPDLKTILDMASKDATLFLWTTADYESPDALQVFIDAGIQQTTLRPEDYDTLRKMVDEVMDEMAAEDAFFAKTLQSYRAWRDKYLPWYELSRLK